MPRLRPSRLPPPLLLNCCAKTCEESRKIIDWTINTRCVTGTMRSRSTCTYSILARWRLWYDSTESMELFWTRGACEWGGCDFWRLGRD